MSRARSASWTTSTTTTIDEDAFANGFTMSFNYGFKHREPSKYDHGYVQALNKDDKLSFVGNSGVKMTGTSGTNDKPHEVAILDVDAMVLVPSAGQDAFDPVESGYGILPNGDVNVSGFEKESLSTLMTGVIYDGVYDFMEDYTAPPTGSSPIEEAQAYHDALISNLGHQNSSSSTVLFQPMVISVQPNGSLFELTVEIDGTPTYEDDDFDISGISGLLLQSHWGSGVVFSDVNVVRTGQ